MDCFQLVFFSEPPMGHAYTGCHGGRGLFSLVTQWFGAGLTHTGKMVIPWSDFFLWIILFALISFLSLFLIYFVHCQFRPLLVWHCTAHARSMCNLFVKSHLEDAPVITSILAFQSHRSQAMSLEPRPHPSALRNPKISEHCMFTCMWCYILQETGRDPSL